jgi:hypothetical protein
MENLREEIKSDNPKQTAESKEVDYKKLLACDTTLNDLENSSKNNNLKIIKSSYREMLGLEENEPSDKICALPEEVTKDFFLGHVAFMTLLYQHRKTTSALNRAYETGDYTAAAIKKIDEMLKNVNDLLQKGELTNERTEALEKFNLTLNELKKNFNPFVRLFGDGPVIDVGTKQLFADVQSAFNTLSDAFNSHVPQTQMLQQELQKVFATGLDDLKISLKENLGVHDITKDDILKVIAKWSWESSDSQEQAFERQQYAFDSMPEILEKMKKLIKNTFTDISIAEEDILKGYPL